jgi:UDP-N-acetylglucosamine transferase subunit ALG13
MIFATVGTQLSFSRLIKHIDNWPGAISTKVIAQVFDDKNRYKNIEVLENVNQEDYVKLIESCSCIVSHAGMGSIITALKYNKPIILFPREKKYNEHRNDHQLATIKSFSKTQGIYIATTESELLRLLDNHMSLEFGSSAQSVDLVELCDFIKFHC